MIHEIKHIFSMFRFAWCLMTGHLEPSCAPWSPSHSQSPCSSPPSRWRPSQWTGTRSSPRRSTPGPSSGTATGSWFSSGASRFSSQCPGPSTTQSNQHSHAPLTTGARYYQKFRVWIFILISISACAVNDQSSVGVAGDVPGPVPGAAGRHHGCLHPHLLPPLGRGTYRGGHPAAAAAETGQQEEDHQDACPRRDPFWSIMASPKSLPSHLRLESVWTFLTVELVILNHSQGQFRVSALLCHILH